MARRMRIHDLTLTGVYDDRWLPLVQAIAGEIEIARASHVEWENGEWVARLRSTGEEIARGPNRSDVIGQEIKYLEERL